MRSDRFSSLSIRTAAVLLAGLLLAAGHPAVGQITFRFGKRTREKVSSVVTASAVAAALAHQVGEVQKRFAESRHALRTVNGPHGEPAFARQEVGGLIVRTKEDLDQAISRVGEPRLEALRAWSDEELRPIQEELAAPADHTAALPSGLFAPRAVAVVASLGGIRLPWFASVTAAAPQQATIGAEKTNQLLDQVGEVVGRIFFLGAHDDLKVKLWVGSTPAQRVNFSFWPQGNIKGSLRAQMSIRTNDKQEVLRGLYSYRAAWSKGRVTQLIEYPNPAGAPDAQQSDRLDLVNGSGFFCCDFDVHSCLQVDNEKKCRP